MDSIVTRQDLDAGLVKLRKRYGHRPDVTAFDIGYRWTGDAPTDEICLRIHVARKIPEAELQDLQVFAREIDGIRIDVVPRTYCVHLQTGEGPSDTASFLLSGSACSRADTAGGGTIGAMVVDNRSGMPGFLSNWHVLCGPHGAPGDRIVSRADGVTRPLGTLVRADLSEWGDAAFARFEGASSWLPGVMGLSQMVTGQRRARLGEVLSKYGRATGLTQARVDGEGVYRVAFKDPSGGEEIREIRGLKLVPLKQVDRHQLETSAPGDSGALWVDAKDGQAVGLHFAGEGSALGAQEYALACDLGTVLDRLDVRLATLSDVLEAGRDAGLQEPASPPHPDPLDFPAMTSAYIGGRLVPISDVSCRYDPMPISVPIGGPIGGPVPVHPTQPDPSPLADPRDTLCPGFASQSLGGPTGGPAVASTGGPTGGPTGGQTGACDPLSRQEFEYRFPPAGRMDAGTAISVSCDIWPELAAAFHAVFPEFRAGLLNPAMEVQEVIQGRDPGLVLSRVIQGSDPFLQDGVMPAWLALRRARTLWDVCQDIGRAYRDLGYTVTT